LVILLALAVLAGVLLAVLNTSSVLSRREKVELEAAMLARQYRNLVDDLENKLLRIEPATAETTRLLVQKDRQRLNEWLAARLAASDGDGSKMILLRMGAAMRAYFEQLDQLAANPDGFRKPMDRDSLAKYDDASDRLESLADDFAALHDRSLQDLLQASLGSVFWMRNLVFGCLALLVAAIGLVTVLFYRDVIHPLREQLVDSRSMLVKREKLAALGGLVAGLAHEIRNPLTAIKARLYTLRFSPAAGQGQEHVQAITNEVDRLERIVRDVLGYAHPAQPMLGRVDLSAWLREFASFIEPEMASHHIRLSVSVAAAVEVCIDAGQLRQIMLNLVRNAQEALAGRPGRITLTLHREWAKLLGRPRNVAVLAVVDDGPGIPAEVQARLFDPFFTTKPAGTGLGLSIAATLVENQGGEIAFHSSPATGTRFAVRLPINGEHPK
jgi:signal transduction histidine kinase